LWGGLLGARTPPLKPKFTARGRSGKLLHFKQVNNANIQTFQIFIFINQKLSNKETQKKKLLLFYRNTAKNMDVAEIESDKKQITDR
jgi:hypothetical protein